jgi:hypothetical protein
MPNPSRTWWWWEICLIHATNNNHISRKQAIHLRYSYHIFLLCRLKWSSQLLPGFQSVIFHIRIACFHQPCSPNCITVTILRDQYKSRRYCMTLRIPRLWTEHLRCSVKRHYRRHWGFGGASCLILRYKRGIIKMKTAAMFVGNIGTCLSGYTASHSETITSKKFLVMCSYLNCSR